jgi:hypothetical protein
MCLEHMFSGYLAYSSFSRLSLEVMTRALSVDRKERGSVLSTFEIEPRTPTVKLNCSNVHPWFSGSELKKSNTGEYRARFSASFFVSQSG